MAQTTDQRERGAREIVRQMFPTEVTANLNFHDFVAAITAIDLAMDAMPAQANPALTIKQNLVGILPEPFKSHSTVQQKALVLSVWAMVETGIL